MSRLKSRKFWVTVLTGTLLVVARAMELDLDETTVHGIVATVIGYLASQGWVDSKKPAIEVVSVPSASTLTFTDVPGDEDGAGEDEPGE